MGTETSSNSDSQAEWPWAIAIFTARETVETVIGTVHAAAEAASRQACIDVLVNGNEGLAKDLCSALAGSNSSDSQNSLIRIWHIPLADKAHAWNVYLHQVAPPAITVFFIDGYARVHRDALERLQQRFDADPQAIAATGVPRTGRSAGRLARQMVDQGGIHGNLFAIEGATMTRMRGSGFRLPLGLYRTDGAIGAVLNFNLDPSTHSWEVACTAVVDSAEWTVPEKKWWRVSDLRTQWRRVFLQAQGVLENAAIREHLAVRKQSPQSMPRTNAELVLGWLRDNPPNARALLRRHPLSWFAVRRLSKSRDWSQAEGPPRQITVNPETG